MASDKTVDDKTGTKQIFVTETLSNAHFCRFYYLEVAKPERYFQAAERPILIEFVGRRTPAEAGNVESMRG
jgi:hypothetical protein